MKSKIHKCEKCDQTFTLAWNLKQHLKHSKYCGTSEEEFKCANCGKKFTLSATLKHHFARCIAVDPYRFSCTHCPRKFTFKSSLRKHLRKRCPNINYDSTNETNYEVFEFVEQLEEVHIDEIDFRNADVKKELTNSNIKVQKCLTQSDEETEFTVYDIQEDNMDLNIEQDIELKFIYEDSYSSDEIKVE